MSATFYLGTHQPGWLRRPEFADVPLFVSCARLQDLKKLPVALGRHAWDSRGFTQIRKHGRWTITARQYVDELRRYVDTIGMPDFIAIQDWMCETPMIRGRRDVSPSSPLWAHGTRAARGIPEDGPDEPLDDAIYKHEVWTRDSYLELHDLAPELPFLKTLQGQTLPQYQRCAALYAEAGIDLTDGLVGLGSVCRRQSTREIAEIVGHFAAQGMQLHGFGVKTDGLSMYGADLASADSMAWSWGERRRGHPRFPECAGVHKNCANCPRAALAWRDRVLARLA